MYNDNTKSFKIERIANLILFSSCQNANIKLVVQLKFQISLNGRNENNLVPNVLRFKTKTIMWKNAFSEQFTPVYRKRELAWFKIDSGPRELDMGYRYHDRENLS